MVKTSDILVLGIAGMIGWFWLIGDEESDTNEQQQVVKQSEQWTSLGPLEGKPETVTLVRQSWEKVKAHCPGFKHYSIDLRYVGLQDMIGESMGEMSRVEVKFKVAENPVTIPNRYRAWGQTCGYGVSPDGSTLRIQKSQCASVCLGRNYKNTGQDYLASL